MFEFGDRFLYDDGVFEEEYMLVDLLKNKINLVNLKTGKLFTQWEVYVNDPNNITYHDISRLLGNSINWFKWAAV